MRDQHPISDCGPKHHWIVGLCLSVLVVVVVLLASPIGTAQAATASCFGFDWSLDGTESIKTYEAAQDARSELALAGYSASQYANNSGWAAYNNLSSPAILYFAYHGVPDAAYFYSERPVNGGLIWQSIRAEPYVDNSPGDPYLNGARYYLNKAPRVDITQLMLVVLQSCHTADYKLYHYPEQKYCLPHVLVAEKGVDAAIGFRDEIAAAKWNGWNNPTKVWEHAFFQSLRAGNSVATSHSLALSTYKAVWHDYGGYNSGQIFGNGSLVITPARNGAED